METDYLRQLVRQWHYASEVMKARKDHTLRTQAVTLTHQEIGILLALGDELARLTANNRTCREEHICRTDR